MNPDAMNPDAMNPDAMNPDAMIAAAFPGPYAERLVKERACAAAHRASTEAPRRGRKPRPDREGRAGLGYLLEMTTGMPVLAKQVSGTQASGGTGTGEEPR